MKNDDVHSFFLVVVLVLAAALSPAVATAAQWQLLKSSIGVSAMHMQLLPNDRVVVFDRTDFGPSNLSLPDGRCRDDPRDWTLSHDCTAHAAEYDVATNAVRALTLETDPWCSSATLDPDGRLVQTGGANDGERAVRYFNPCFDCDWKEEPAGLAAPRWYATNHVLPDGTAIVVGGRSQPSFEFVPKNRITSAVVLPLLRDTNDPGELNNLYPFVYLNVDGNLFIFANNRSILFDYNTNTVFREYPPTPDGDPRNYPCAGSSVLLPLPPSGDNVQVLICGGAPRGAFVKASTQKLFVGALKTCLRMGINDPSPTWSIETMPSARVMGDMVLLPDGDEVLIVNGAAAGSSGWELGRDPVLAPVGYRPGAPAGVRFEVKTPTTVPRMYHSSAVLLRDGRVLVGGSNPHAFYNFTGVDYPTDLSLEAYSPEYLAPEKAKLRPRVVAAPKDLVYGERFTVRFDVAAVNEKQVRVTMLSPSFATHSFSMNQRLLILEAEETAPAVEEDEWVYEVAVVAPRSAFIAPPGYYMLFIVNGGIPSEGIWVHIQPQ
ncbi:aldehyde oxidase GLOX-like [Zingiber officinale]|uniref:Galactose oxidase n=1 Tax=Zingiber officinale TaxID=94328 RepID=A0A8J5HC77_ZINOF|nr:aldehyde oxidase GLOX-like [Zingiber officinale]KAG6520736.1 hypothetical protein ZIOFF_017796 [Zingiber officinale]